LAKLSESMSAARECLIHGEWVDDGTTDDCPECLADRLAGVHTVCLPIFVSGGATWRVECSCGWDIETRFRDDALMESRSHVAGDGKVVALRPKAGTPTDAPAPAGGVIFEADEERVATEQLAVRMAGQSLLLAQIQQKVNKALIQEVPEMGGQVLVLLMESGAKIYLQVGQARVEVTE